MAARKTSGSTARKNSTAKKASKKTAPKGRKKLNATKPPGPRKRPQYDLAPGMTLTRKFKGKDLEVQITDAGFVYEDETFKSISAVARHIVGYQISGPVFFGLTPTKTKEATS